jgi:hypothetical protein
MTKQERNHYSNCHVFLSKNYGKASHCSNPNCEVLKPRRFEWALKKGRTCSKNIDDYMPLCPSCHRKYDFTEATREKLKVFMKGKCFHGRERSIIRMSNDNKTELYSSVTLAAKENGILHTSIANCLSGRSKTASGFKWKYSNG